MNETTTTSLSRQLEELHLLTCSLLPGESLSFSPTFNDEDIWIQLLESYPEIDTTRLPSSSAQFEVKVTGSNIWFEVKFPDDYGNDGACLPLVSVRGEQLTRNEQAQWQSIVAQRMKELNDSEYIVYDLTSAHLLPLLHAEAEERRTTTGQEIPTSSEPNSTEEYHALLTSHHLISPTKRRNLQLWSSQLNISGFAKVGYPGIIYAEGSKDNVEDFVARIKAMQWLALRVRFVEPVSGCQNTSGATTRTWTEFEKVGQVVEEMRRVGRENFMAEVGIGSTSFR